VFRSAGTPLRAGTLTALGAAAALSGAGISSAGSNAEPGSYSDGPPLAHTGGFDEPTCVECHSDRPLHDGAGSLSLRGIDSLYTPGQPLRVEVLFEQAELEMAGFQLSARWLDDQSSGSQAGSFRALDDRVQVLRSGTTGVEYVQHTFDGTALQRPGLAVWAVEWVAPELSAGAGVLAIDVAANAANDDFSEYGDQIFAHRFVIRPDRGGANAHGQEDGHSGQQVSDAN